MDTMNLIVDHLTHMDIPAYRICMQSTESTSHGIILSCLIDEMRHYWETDGVIVPNDAIIKTKKTPKVHPSDLHIFQINPPSFIKVSFIRPNEFLYIIDIEFLLSKFRKLEGKKCERPHPYAAIKELSK